MKIELRSSDAASRLVGPDEQSPRQDHQHRGRAHKQPRGDDDSLYPDAAPAKVGEGVP